LGRSFSARVRQLDGNLGTGGMDSLDDRPEGLGLGVVPKSQIGGADPASGLNGGGFDDDQADSSYGSFGVVAEVPGLDQAVNCRGSIVILLQPAGRRHDRALAEPRTLRHRLAATHGVRHHTRCPPRHARRINQTAPGVVARRSALLEAPRQRTAFRCPDPDAPSHRCRTAAD